MIGGLVMIWHGSRFSERGRERTVFGIIQEHGVSWFALTGMCLIEQI